MAEKEKPVQVVVSPWLSARAAAMRLGVNRYALMRRAASGLIRTKADPGEHVRFHVADIDRLIAEEIESAATP
jgi:predicted site-specific integrase-resolvase